MLAVIIALIGAVATVVAALIQTLGSPSGSSAGSTTTPARSTTSSGSPSSSSAHLSIDRVSFSTKNGHVILTVSGTYNSEDGDGYLYAVARPSKVPYGTAEWLVSEPVTPDKNGHWTAVITLTSPRQKMTVFAVLAGGCPPGNVCGPNPEAVRKAIEEGGPSTFAVDYSTQPSVVS
jgi:FlaG/FlaF family flagellin (archaellin)